MNWVQIAWIMMIAASLMLGVVHLFVWQKQRSQYANLLFFVLAVSAAAYGAYELARMQAETPADLATSARWSHVPLAAFVISVVGFVRLYFNAGRLWLAYSVIGIRLVALALNFLTGVNVNFREITALDHLQLWGGAVVSEPIGILNPWAIVPQLSNLLLVVFIVDASITLWRRGGEVSRRRAAFVGGSLAFCNFLRPPVSPRSGPDVIEPTRIGMALERVLRKYDVMWVRYRAPLISSSHH